MEGVRKTSSNTYILWECPILVPYWTNLFGFINKNVLTQKPFKAVLGAIDRFNKK